MELINKNDVVFYPVMPKEYRNYQTMNLDDAYEQGWEDLQAFVAKMPSIDAVPQWIPCSKRMPEESEQTYWCCSETGYQFQCRWTNNMYGFGATEYSKWGWHVMDKPQYSTVIAWMPLPKPYERKESCIQGQ